MVDRGVTRTACTAFHLIRGVADNHVKLHLASKQLGYSSLDVVGMDERIGVGFKPFTTVERLLTYPAKLAFAIDPCVFDPLKPNVTRVAGEASTNRVRTLGVLGAI